MTEKDVIEKLKEVKDPELEVDVYTLGLIYKIIIGEEGVEVLMTLTTPLCPFGDEIVQEVENKLAELDPDNAIVELTFDPPWKPSDELRTILGG
jgi:metal-sulfur cluster biosynthetic enzyme